MGLQDRDYMRQPAKDARLATDPEESVEGFLSAFLQRHPRFLLYFGIALGAVLLVALVLAKVSAGSR